MDGRLLELLARAPVLTDGAWGTELQRRGLPLGEFPDFWNVLHPENVEAVARSYVEAGSRVILTNTFGANRIRLESHGLAWRLEEINYAGVQISLRAAAGRARVFASIGPSGKLLLNNEVAASDLAEAFREQAHVLADGGADALVIETMSDLEEATLAIAAARSTGLPVIACMVFDYGANSDRTMMGVTPEQAASRLTAAGADVIGANCGLAIEHFIPICQRLRASTDRPIWIKPNAGLPKILDGQAVYEIAPQIFATHLPTLIKAGADFVGGCCGTNPEFIRAMHQILSAGEIP
jgi:5-methyltetrahydrofolate--homocysteine methyltransferase